MSNWQLTSYPMYGPANNPSTTVSWQVADMHRLNEYGYPVGYSLKHIRNIHRALLSLSDEDYAKVVALIESEEELYE